MYRTLRSLILSASLLSMSYALAEVNLKVDPCTLDALVNGTCGITSDVFLYSQKYGKRSVEITEDYVSADNESNLTPELGWHSSQRKIAWISTNLTPGNIRKDKVIFGVTGTLDDAPLNNCVAQDPASETSANLSADCYVPSGNQFVYSSYLGGRNNACTLTQIDASQYQIQNKLDASKPNGACWIDTSSPTFPAALKTSNNPNFVVRNTLGNNTCPRSGSGIGLQSVSCTTPDRTEFNGYYYPATLTPATHGVSKNVSGAFGGRSKECIYGSNTEPCWIDDPDAYVQNDTSCTEKLPDGSTNANGTPIADLGTDLNAYSCKTSDTNRFIYRNSKGGRAANCNAINRTGYCYIEAFTASDFETDLIPENIQKGLVLFGVRGTLDLADIVYGSGAHRQPSGTATPNRIAYKEASKGESNLLEASPNGAASAIYPTSYNPIPKVASNSEADVTGVDRTGWSNTECGLTGSLTTRLANCASVFGASAKWMGTVKGNAGQSDWELVTRKVDSVDTNKTYEVWKDTGTGLMWSSLVSSNLNWCKASGSNGRKITQGAETIYDPVTSAEDDPFNYCDTTTYQNQTTPISACALDTPDAQGLHTFSTSYSSANTPGKAGLLPSLDAANGKVHWRLPSIYDYMLANHHGLRFVLPDAGVNSDDEWTATTHAANRKNAWTFSGKTGARLLKQRNSAAAVRCIGR